MTDEHRKLWVEACQERERIRAALQSLIKIGPRPWMDGGVSWAEWDWMLGEWATDRLNDFLYPTDLSVHIER